jgi:predicted nucleotidyltransferase
MIAHSQHKAMIVTVAKNLGDLCSEVVFVGGSSVGFLITDRAAPDVRPTNDVDIVIAVKSQVHYHRVEDKLRAMGFRQNGTATDRVICRWIVDGVLVDVMPDDENILGFSCKWYSEAMKNAFVQDLDDGLKISMITAPYFLASKLEAFYGRGGDDLVLSHDIEDIIAVVNGRPSIVEEVRSSKENLKRYLKKEFRKLSGNDDFHEAVLYSLQPDAEGQKRQEVIFTRVKGLAEI